MKKMLMSAALLLMGATAMNAQNALFGNGLGINVGYSGWNENAGIGVHARLHLVNGLRVEPTFDYYFKKDYLSQWDVMANFHYVFPVASKIGLYPLVGVGVAGFKAGDWSTTKFSMNFGAGIEFPVASDFSLGLEMKGQYINDVGDSSVKFCPAFKATYIF